MEFRGGFLKKNEDNRYKACVPWIVLGYLVFVLQNVSATLKSAQRARKTLVDHRPDLTTLMDPP